MISSFGDKATEALFHGSPRKAVAKFPSEIVSVALRKLDALNAAADLLDLRSPPGNRLEALSGDLHGFHSIRVNDQWRLIFRWQKTSAGDVSLVDYHR